MNQRRFSPSLIASAIAVAIAAGGVATEIAKADDTDDFEQNPNTVQRPDIPDPPDCEIPPDPLHSYGGGGMACWKEWQAYAQLLQRNPDVGAWCDAVFDSELVCWLIDKRDIDVTMEFPEGIGTIEVYHDGELYDEVSSDCAGEECRVALPTGFWGMSLTSHIVLPYGTTFVIRPAKSEGFFFFDLHTIPSLREVLDTGVKVPILSHPNSKELNTSEELVMSFTRTVGWP